ncbi:hypothetical protein ACF1GW_08755 [Streptomyces achromogenes]|uniref:hypothetical protein n=1 Tax=Streptomyces achromogenes TaxID=67255 RepID=UPI0036FD4E72
MNHLVNDGLTHSGDVNTRVIRERAAAPRAAAGLCEGGSGIRRVRVHPGVIEDREGRHGPHSPSLGERHDAYGDILEIHDAEQVAERLESGTDVSLGFYLERLPIRPWPS